MQHESDGAGVGVLAIIDSLTPRASSIELERALLRGGIRPWHDIPDFPLPAYPSSERGPKIHWCLRHGITSPSRIAVLLGRTVGSVNGHLQDMRGKGLLPLAVVPRPRNESVVTKTSKGLNHEITPGTVSPQSGSILRPNHEKSKRSKVPSFVHAEVFPHIAQAIATAPKDKTGFVGHNSIVSSMLADQELKPLIAKAKTTRPEDSHRDIATNMLSWFSQKITEQKNPWGDFFVIKKQGSNGHLTYSYRLKLPSESAVAADELSSLEGNLRLVVHSRRERDASLARAKKDCVFRELGKLQCEACDLTMDEAYHGSKAIFSRRTIASL
jgi:hypothetical protein